MLTSYLINLWLKPGGEIQSILRTKSCYLWFFLTAVVVWISILGLENGNPWQTVFRETKMILYFLAFFPFFRLLREPAQLRALLLSALLFVTVASFANYLNRYLGNEAFWAYSSGVALYKNPAYGEFHRGYVWGVTYELFAFLIIISITIARGVFSSYKVWLVPLGIFNVINIFLMLSRGAFTSMMLGILSLALIWSVHRQGFWRFTQVLIIIAMMVGTLMVLRNHFDIFGAWTDRYLSLLFPYEHGTSGDVANREYRLYAIKLGLQQLTKTPLGRGLGETRFLGYLGHSLYGWLFFRTGYLALGILGGYMLVMWRLLRRFFRFRNEEYFALGAAFLACIVVLFANGVAANLLFAPKGELVVTVFLFAAMERLVTWDAGATANPAEATT